MRKQNRLLLAQIGVAVLKRGLMNFQLLHLFPLLLLSAQHERRHLNESRCPKMVGLNKAAPLIIFNRTRVKATLLTPAV